MKAVRAILITALLLLFVWALLGVIGWITGVLPELPVGSEDEDAGVVADAALAIDVGTRAEGTRADAGIDAGKEDVGITEELEMRTSVDHSVMRFRVCDHPSPLAHSVDRSFVVGELLGGGPPEIVVGCADHFVVIGIAAGATELMGMRLAEIRIVSTRDVVKHTARASITDVTGDGKPDLLLPFFFVSERGGSRGGRLALWARTESGFSRPRLLGHRTFRNVTPIDLDGRGSMDFVVVDQGRPWAGAEGAVHFYQGGTRPRVRAQREAGMVPRNAIVVDIDQDGKKDVVTSSMGFSDGATRNFAAIRVFRRTNVFRFEETQVAAQGHWGLLAGDLDDDGYDDVIIGGLTGLAVLYSRPRADLEGLALESIWTGRGGQIPLDVTDVDGDGLNDLIFEDRGDDSLSWLARTQTGYRIARSCHVDDVLEGAAMIQIDGTPVLVWAQRDDEHLDLIVVQYPTFTEIVPHDAFELHEAPFFVRAEVH